MTGSPTVFDLRLVAYTPLGARGAVIPDLGFTFTATAAGPTLTAKVSTVVYGSLPQNLEVAVEAWHTSTGAWVEGRDSRFVITQFDTDDRDRTGTVTLTGLGLAAWLLGATALAGVDPYQAVGNVEAAASLSTVSVSGTTFTWASHVLAAGDRVRVTAKGNAKNISAQSVYFVRNPTASTFQLSASPSGALINAGTASNIGMARVRTRIVFTGADAGKFTRSMAISVVNAAGSNLTDGSTYYVTGATSSSIQVATAPGGVPLELNANSLTVYRFLDGQRVFNNATPGTVMDAVFLGARDRGWGQKPPGTDVMLHSWTTGAGSDGVAWSRMADDPTTPGISVGFQPGTPGTQVLQFLLDNEYAEWYTTGRVVGLVNYGTGVDHTTDATPRRIGTTATAVQVQTDLTSMRNAYTVRGVGPVIKQVDGTPGAWGRLEVFETATGATSVALAGKQGATDLAAHSAPTVGYTVTEQAAVAVWLPLINYTRGDWIAVQLAGTGWTRLRCVGWAFTKAPAAATTVTVYLENIKPTVIHKLAHKTASVTAGLSATSTGQSLLQGDNRKAAPPAGLALTSSGSFANDGAAVAVITATWLPVTSDIDGGDLTVSDYDVWVRPSGAFYGHSVGDTGGTTADAGPYPSNHVYAVMVRAKSDQGAWGEFCPEVEITTAYPVTVPNPPTAPTITGKLGSVRVAWDGNLVDPTLGTEAPERGFAYVYAAYCTTQAGTYIPAGTNMGNAGYTPITGLTVGSAYWFALFAVNSIGVVSQMSPAVQFTVVGVKGPDIEANSVTANSIAAGAITADKLDVGTVPSGNPINRVPMPLTQPSFWNLALAGQPLVSAPAAGSVTPTTSGIQLASSATAQAVQWVTQRINVPKSGTVHLSGLTTGGVATFMLRELDAVGNATDSNYPITPDGVVVALAATTHEYAVLIRTNGFSISDTVESAHVFEAIGTSTEGVQITPDGLRIFSGETPVPILALTSSSNDVVTLSDSAGDQVATIDQAGNAAFTEISADSDFDLAGSTLFGPSSNNLANAYPNGTTWAIAAPGDTTGIGVLDIPGRSCLYQARWNGIDGLSVGIQNYYVSSDVFMVEDGRMVQLVLTNGGLQTDNGSGGNVYARLQVGLVPFNATYGDGTTVMSEVVYNGTKGPWSHAPVTFTTRTMGTPAIDYTNYVLPAGVPLYWQYVLNSLNTPTAAYVVHEYGVHRGLTVVDLGSSQRIAGAPVDATDGRTSGSQVVASTSTPTTTTATFTAAWSASYHDSGGTKVVGTGTYDNAKLLYQGNGVTPMGAQYGFSATDRGKFHGKNISSAYIYLKNAYMAYSGSGVARIGTHSNTAPAATIGNAYGANEFGVGWSSGSGKWVALSSAIRTGLSNGTVTGFQVGIDGSNTDYMKFEGVGYGSHPPLLKVTFS